MSLNKSLQLFYPLLILVALCLACQKQTTVTDLTLAENSQLQTAIIKYHVQQASSRDGATNSCPELIFPLDLQLPEGEIVEIENAELLETFLLEWEMEFTEADGFPELVFPMAVLVEEKVVEVADESDLESLYANCEALEEEMEEEEEETNEAENNGLKILPLGNSITVGVPHTYRYQLSQILNNANFAYNFVGSLNGDNGDGEVYPADWDKDHEGHSGWTTGDINEQLSDWLDGYTPDMALIHLGTNDVFRIYNYDLTMEESVTAITEIIQKLRTDNPQITILLAQILPFTEGFEGGSIAPFNDLVTQWNMELTDLASTMCTADSPIIMVDINSDFDDSEFSDGFHPNEKGATKMAQRWANAILSDWTCANANPIEDCEHHTSPTVTIPEPNFAGHDVSEIVEIAPNVYTTFSSSNPSYSHRLQQFYLDMNQPNPAWTSSFHWPVGQPDPNMLPFHVPWMEQFDYNGQEQIEHNELAAVAPSVYDANTVYFHLYNNPGRVWAVSQNKEPAMFAGIYRATATGSYPNQTWTMEPYPVYYSDDTTFDRGGPRGVDANVWQDKDEQMYMTFGSWDPEDQNVICIADMDETTGRIEGFDANTPGYYPDGGHPAIHPIATFGEGAFSFHYGDYYYLFLNLGGCCSGVNSTYRIVVGRSQNLYGPYLDDQGKNFMTKYNDGQFAGKEVLAGLNGQTKYIGPGHTGIIETNGKIGLSFHYYDGDDGGKPKMGTRELAFDADGWPYVVSDASFSFQ
ncbi:MAG: family 43 glycosylhydrolase [Bacteroidota bacterium]